MSDQRVPVTLLTGFLGAGKTTLLNSVLSDASAGQVAVIVNEFGEAGLDHDLVEGTDGDVVLMQSGCLCCSIRGELSRTVAGLMYRRLSGEFSFDRIVIETTGLADPGPVLQTLRTDDVLAKNTRSDGIVTVVDAVNAMTTLDAQFEAVSQVALADLVVVSKADLVAPEQVIQLEERLRGLNPRVRIEHAVRGAGVAQKIWGLSPMQPEAKPAAVLDWTAGKGKKADPMENMSGLFAAPPSMAPAFAHNHDARINSVSVELETPLADEVFDRWLDTLIKEWGQNILRVKGIVFLQGIDLPFVFHGVQHVFDPPVQLREWPREDRKTRIVVIGRDLSESKLRHSLRMLQDASARAGGPSELP